MKKGLKVQIRRKKFFNRFSSTFLRTQESSVTSVFQE